MLRRHALPCLVSGLALSTTQAQTKVCSRPVRIGASRVTTYLARGTAKKPGLLPTVITPQLQALDCEVQLQTLSRETMEKAFAQGDLDAMLMSYRTTERERIGQFAPLLRILPVTLLRQGQPTQGLNTLSQILQASQLRLAAVSGNSYGLAYDRTLLALQKQGRIVEAAGTEAALEALAQGKADITVLTPLACWAVVQMRPEKALHPDQLQQLQLRDLEWGLTGSYFSRQTLNPTQRDALINALNRVVTSGELWQALTVLLEPGSMWLRYIKPV
jgi:ABC-type amino acid transport substrate-binding protein